MGRQAEPYDSQQARAIIRSGAQDLRYAIVRELPNLNLAYGFRMVLEARRGCRDSRRSDR